MTEAGLDINNNYCNNALGSAVSGVSRPWCYFESGELVPEWGFCDISSCEKFCANHATKIPTTAYMTTAVLSKPARQKLKRRDPFVTCWNECYHAGRLNGPKCMDNCMKVSSKATLF